MAVEVTLIEDIDGWGYTHGSLRRELKAAGGSAVVIPINSYGGSVMEGMAIYEEIKRYDGETTADILAYAMSCGTMIACAADKVVMPANGFYMIHNAWSVMWGEASDFEQEAAFLRKIGSVLADIYVSKTGLPEDQIRQMMDDTTWLTGKEALEMGFVDELTDAIDIAASYQPTHTAAVADTLPNTIKALTMSKTPATPVATPTPAPVAAKPTEDKANAFFNMVKNFFSPEPEPEPAAPVADKDPITAQIAALNEQMTTMQASLQSITEAKAKADQDLAAANAEVARLKAAPAAKPTGGAEGNTSGGDASKVKSYMTDAVTKAARAAAAKNKDFVRIP